MLEVTLMPCGAPITLDSAKQHSFGIGMAQGIYAQAIGPPSLQLNKHG